jgi:diaminohydroxyphosphoribosylaminopyrimidine deaminase/5-amino-6-(5-phosphoribosylamino)uracil reductase
MSFTVDDRRHMAHALQLARQGLYTTDPNPRVGCVLVRQGAVVGSGWHVRAGQPHAERHALEAAGESAREATAYITLEPCAHTGHTSPCADALIEAGVARVVIAMADPNPAGRGGAERLRQTGIAVDSGLLADEARALNPGFIRRMSTGRPFVRLKLAASLDGRTAMASGESQWITGAAARDDVQRLRARSSAVVTGRGTAVTDQPSLTVRPAQWQWPGYPEGGVRQPLRVVLDHALATPVDTPLVTAAGSVLIAGTEAADPQRRTALEAAGAEVVTLASASGGVSLPALLDELGRRACNEVLFECGAELAGSLVRAGLADELVLYMAPALLGSSARPLVALPDIEQMSDQLRLERKDLRTLGDDLRLTLGPTDTD